ncbi:MAG: hypothetical protein DRJ50_12490, partial [Actinobacteria bacterium]
MKIDINIESGEATALVFDPAVGAAIVRSGGEVVLLPPGDAFDTLADIERRAAPRWVWWSRSTARLLVENGIRPARCWDLASVHRLLFGGWRASAATIWATCKGLDLTQIPEVAPIDLFTVVDEFDEPDQPVREDGYLRPDWVEGAWAANTHRLQRWAELIAEVHGCQVSLLEGLADRPAAPATARSESAAELLGVELENDGLPINIAEAERIIADFVGPRPLDAAAA